MYIHCDQQPRTLWLTKAKLKPLDSSYNQDEPHPHRIPEPIAPDYAARWWQLQASRPPATFGCCWIPLIPPTALSKGSTHGARPDSEHPLTSNSSIVLVPGIGTAPPETWPFADPQWLAALPGSGTRASILEYDYASLFAGTKPSWEALLMLGYDLLQHLSDARPQRDPDLVGDAV